MNKEKSKLYRKVNTKTHGVRHDYGGDFKNTRNKKEESFDQTRGKMSGRKNRGLDYTPLFKFLLYKLSNPDLKASVMKPTCTCCTHTFNGELFGGE